MKADAKKLSLPPIAFTDDQRHEINDQTLENDELPAEVDPFFGSEQGDVVELWVGESRSSGDFVSPTYTIDDPSNVLVVSFRRIDLLKVNNKRAYFGYRVNGGELSTVVGIPVSLSESAG